MKEFLRVTFSLSVLTCLFSIVPASAQDEPPPPMEWGEVSMADLAMKIYAPDTNASAVVLCDYGETIMNNDVGLTFKRHRRIKILTAAGYPWGTHTVYLYTGKDGESISDIEGVTYALGGNGQVMKTEMDRSSIFKDDYDKRYSWCRFTLPALTPGCIIEYRYTVSTLDNLWSIRDWQFQWEQPVVWSEYRVTVPRCIAYAAVTRGFAPFAIDERLDTKLHLYGETAEWVGEGFPRCYLRRWVARNVPALRDEPYVTTMDDYAIRVDLQLSEYVNAYSRIITKVLKTWDEFAKEMLDDNEFGRRIEPSGSLRALGERLTAGLTKPEARMAAVYDYVKSTIVWDGARRWYSSRDPGDVLESRKGTSGEVNFVLLGLLKGAGLEASPVMLSTRSHGKIQELYPIMDQFNHVVVLVQCGSARYFLDATNPIRPIDLVPAEVLNVRGFVVKKESPEWVTITTPKHFIHNGKAEVRIAENGEIAGTVECDDEEYSSLSKRADFRDKKPAEIARQIFDSARSGVSLDSVVVTGKDSLERPLIVRAKVTSGSYAQGAGDLIYINPLVIGRLYTNPFKSPKREFPVDMGYGSRTRTVVDLVLPEGFEVKESPVDKLARIGMSDAWFTQKTVVDGRHVRVEADLDIERIEYPPAMYQQLKTFYEHMTAWQSEQIVLQRKVTSPARGKK